MNIFKRFCERVGFCQNISDSIFSDTTAVELLSAISLLLSGFLIYLSMGQSPFSDQAINNEKFWSTILLIFGMIQFFTVLSIRIYSTNIMRSIISLVAGAFWVWMGLKDLSIHLGSNDIVIVLLGMANLWAFVYNFLTCPLKIQSGNRNGN